MKELVFVGGFPSGGTDLLKSIMNAHPDIYINGEMPFLYKLSRYGIGSDFKVDSEEKFRQLKEICLKYDIWKNLENIDSMNYEIMSDKEGDISTFFEVAFSENNKKIWGNKTPQNTENIQLLTKYFPKAKFIIIIRDIRDVVLSWEKKWGKNKFLTASKWNSRIGLLNEDSNILCLRYEDLIEDLEDSTKGICDFLELPWSSDMLSHYKKTSKIIDGKINYGKKIVADNKEKWRNGMSKPVLKRVEELAYETLIKYNYEITIAQSAKDITYVENLVGKFQDLYATLFIGNRFSEKNTFFNRLRFTYNQILYRK